jgi:aminoglycoside phosphotransferase family enzyme/predicted kinase
MSELTRIIEACSSPDAYEHPVSDVEVHQTHISVVFLAGSSAYKVKKPVELGFLDFTTLALRRHYCHEEVRLNRRLAPDVYLGVVPIVETPDGLGVRERFDEPAAGREAVEGQAEEGEAEEGKAVEYAVKMRRLPDDARLLAWVLEGALRDYHVAVLGRRLARFHAEAHSGPEVSRWGRFETVAGNARENLDQSRAHIGTTLSATVHGRMTEALERELRRLRPLIEGRAESDVPRDTHGDLHLEHVYLFPEQEPPGDLVIIDCIEFNERFRFADPVADMAFLAMDLGFRGRRDLAEVFADAYFDAAEDVEGQGLLRFYTAYRAAVRGKVEGMAAEGPEVPEKSRRAAVRSARAHWLLALSELEPPERRPGLVLVGGLPGTGKSTLADALAIRLGLTVLSSDRTRKGLAGLDPTTSGAADFGEGIYTPEWNERTYAALVEETKQRLFDGERVIVDASFREDARRRTLLDLAAEHGVPGVFLLCDAPPEIVHAHIAGRRGGASDADWAIYEAAAERWEAPSEDTRSQLGVVSTHQTVAWSVEQALAHLAELGLVG